MDLPLLFETAYMLEYIYKIIVVTWLVLSLIGTLVVLARPYVLVYYQSFLYNSDLFESVSHLNNGNFV